MRKKQDKFIPLKDVLAGLFKDKAIPFNPDDALIWNVWDEAVGHAVSRHARPIWIKDGTLRVGVSDPIWLQELKFVEKDILENLNKKLSRKAVDKIEFRVGTK
ncbi:MAG: DUF721 domain-containing protein [Desulfobacterales bacterium]|nr:DUF721 domain-containing protein [Desulfobacterales bacterium]